MASSSLVAVYWRVSVLLHWNNEVSMCKYGVIITQGTSHNVNHCSRVK
jgi:hypothetical protein